MQVHSFPVRVVARPKGATLLLKLVTEHQYKLFVKKVGLLGVGLLGCILVNEPEIAGEDGNLPCCVDTAEVEPALRGLLRVGKERDDGIACKRG